MVSEPDELWTPRQLADFCQVPLQTVYRWNRDGTGPMYFRLGKHARYSRNEVLRWLASKRAEELGYR